MRAAQEAYGVELAHTTIEDADVAGGACDVVTLWHVLEHVEEVAALAELAAGAARRGGTIAVVARAGRSPSAS